MLMRFASNKAILWHDYAAQCFLLIGIIF